MMWQQSSYMGDSGINSGVTTQAPSLSGKEDDMMSYPGTQAPRPSKRNILNDIDEIKFLYKNESNFNDGK